MHLWHAVILGIVEGITEFLPVSSTGHLILSGRVLGLEPTEFLKTFQIAIQLGAILAVVVLYGKTILVHPKIITRVLAAFVPSAAVGLFLYPLVKEVLLSNSDIVAWALFLGGIFMIVFERNYTEHSSVNGNLAKLPYRDAVLIGLFQSLAMVPGVSRAAATVVGGLFLGLKRRAVVEFSFMLAIPTMLAATVLDLSQSSSQIIAADQGWLVLSVGFFTAFGVAILSIKFLLRFIQHHNFIPFGVYRIALALVFWVLTR